MPVAFFGDRAFRIYLLGMFREGFCRHDVPVMKFPLDVDLENRITVFPD